jgi:hypothetical protein
MHFSNKPRKHHPRFFDIHWKLDWLANLSSKVRRYYRFIFNKESGKEWEADVWAMCAFVYLAKVIGCRSDLIEFLKRHPEKTNIFLLSVFGVVYSEAKTKFKKVIQLLRMPFQTT